MNNERILSYSMAHRLSAEDVSKISAAGLTNYVTANGSYVPPHTYDSTIDVTLDF